MNRGYKILIALIIIIVIVLVIRNYNSKQKEKQTAINNLTPPGVFNGNSSVGNFIESIIPTVTIKNDNFKISDKIYSKDITNTYKSASATSGNLDSYTSFQKDQLIGTFLAKEGIWTKVLIANPAHTVYVLTNQIYSK